VAFRLIPKEEKFYADFLAIADELKHGARLLEEMLATDPPLFDKADEIKEVEHKCDFLSHEIYQRLHRTFVTPLDREDIQRVATRLDDILDEMDTAANRMVLFHIETVTDDAKGFGHVLVTATGKLVEAFGRLHNMKEPEAIVSLCVEVHTQENEGDRLVHLAMANLFEHEQDPKEIIKWKDLYEILEKSIDRCEDVADVLQTIVVKNA